MSIIQPETIELTETEWFMFFVKKFGKTYCFQITDKAINVTELTIEEGNKPLMSVSIKEDK